MISLLHVGRCISSEFFFSFFIWLLHFFVHFIIDKLNFCSFLEKLTDFYWANKIEIITLSLLLFFFLVSTHLNLWWRHDFIWMNWMLFDTIRNYQSIFFRKMLTDLRSIDCQCSFIWHTCFLIRSFEMLIRSYLLR